MYILTIITLSRLVRQQPLGPHSLCNVFLSDFTTEFSGIKSLCGTKPSAPASPSSYSNSSPVSRVLPQFITLTLEAFYTHYIQHTYQLPHHVCQSCVIVIATVHFLPFPLYGYKFPMKFPAGLSGLSSLLYRICFCVIRLSIFAILVNGGRKRG